MHIADLYSLSSGSRIDKPHIILKYFPLNIEKYITFHSTSKDTKNYDHWQIVIDSLSPILQKEGISIIQIGAKDDRPIQGCHSLLGQTNIGQTSYIISKALLHCGADSFPVHVASALNKKIVALYANNFISNVGPYWSKPEDVILLEPKRKEGEKPSFLLTGEKSINTILPENIATGICKLLNLEYKNEYKTLEIGPAFQTRTMESVNDCVVDTNKLGCQNIIVRNDYNYNLNNLFGQLQVCKCCIITNKSIPIQPLQQLRQNVIEVIYEITKDHDIKFVKSLFEAKIPFKLYTKLSEEELNPIKLDYLDFPLIYKKDLNPPGILKDIKDYSNIYYRSSRFLVSSNGIFSSFWDYKNSRALPNFNNIPLQLMDINLKEELWCDKEYLYLMEKVGNIA